MRTEWSLEVSLANHADTFIQCEHQIPPARFARQGVRHIYVGMGSPSGSLPHHRWPMTARPFFFLFRANMFLSDILRMIFFNTFQRKVSGIRPTCEKAVPGAVFYAC